MLSFDVSVRLTPDKVPFSQRNCPHKVNEILILFFLSFLADGWPISKVFFLSLKTIFNQSIIIPPNFSRLSLAFWEELMDVKQTHIQTDDMTSYCFRGRISTMLIFLFRELMQNVHCTWSNNSSSSCKNTDF